MTARAAPEREAETRTFLLCCVVHCVEAVRLRLLLELRSLPVEGCTDRSAKPKTVDAGWAPWVCASSTADSELEELVSFDELSGQEVLAARELQRELFGALSTPAFQSELLMLLREHGGPDAADLLEGREHLCDRTLRGVLQALGYSDLGEALEELADSQ
mmetsp:Transcript_97880/g.226951  ORF Transcript_97880/g.226951 Transcript_97880/m.226951 type:complete len:160 (+) Transcript_97880:124-603(+)|eukprot:CAMPEP_0171068230 /NCGR_PEP_ID=MMETSP0766_2-20121228/8446_1 /TAXON_ID=439317 /ORGANISM="Gambierdiscus australes, Strain CAWD 149" /LENGTH=159 /DNA_ID=CAMNT_0011524523 /DNA_START=121 /DNA_END=600 /DNA_ORIENTATION=-